MEGKTLNLIALSGYSKKWISKLSPRIAEQYRQRELKETIGALCKIIHGINVLDLFSVLLYLCETVSSGAHLACLFDQMTFHK